MTCRKETDRVELLPSWAVQWNDLVFGPFGTPSFGKPIVRQTHRSCLVLFGTRPRPSAFDAPNFGLPYRQLSSRSGDKFLTRRWRVGKESSRDRRRVAPP